MLDAFATHGRWAETDPTTMTRMHEWKTFVPTDLDVPFDPDWPDEETSIAYCERYKIDRVFSIVELVSVVDTDSLSQTPSEIMIRTLLVARFTNDKDAVYFRMAISG